MSTYDITSVIDLQKYIHKDLENYNRLIIYFEPKNTVIHEYIINLLLQVKTGLCIEDIINMSTNVCYYNIYGNYVKCIQKQIYMKQNKTHILRNIGQYKSNLFGWSEQDDGDSLDKHVSQKNIDKYVQNIVDINDLDSIKLCKENMQPYQTCLNFCKDTYICESFVEYMLKINAYSHFVIREYITNSRINIMLICDVNEEKKIIPEKLSNIKTLINNINYIITNI